MAHLTTVESTERQFLLTAAAQSESSGAARGTSSLPANTTGDPTSPSIRPTEGLLNLRTTSNSLGRAGDSDSKGGHNKIRSLRKLVSQMKLMPSTKNESNISRKLKLKAQKAKERNEKQKHLNENTATTTNATETKEKTDAKEAAPPETDSKSCQPEEMEASAGKTTATEQIAAETEAPMAETTEMSSEAESNANKDTENTMNSVEDPEETEKPEPVPPEGKKSTSASREVTLQMDRQKSKVVIPASKLSGIKVPSLPNIYLGTKDENDEDDDDDFDDFYAEEEKKLKHAETMPVIPLDRGEPAFPERVIPERERTFIGKEIFLLQKIREARPPTAKRRASITIQNLAKDAEADMKHSWLLEEQNRELWKKFEERKRQLAIVIADENPLQEIEQRLEEVRLMSKPRKDPRHVLERLPEDQRNNIMVSTHEGEDSRGQTQIDQTIAQNKIQMLCLQSATNRGHTRQYESLSLAAVPQRIKK